MKFTDKDNVMDVVKDVAVTTLMVTGTVLAIGMTPKIWKHAEAAIACTSTLASFRAADAVRVLSLAKTYDIKAAREAMLALPRMLVE